MKAMREVLALRNEFPLLARAFPVVISVGGKRKSTKIHTESHN